MRIKNHTRETLNFNLRGKAKNGHPVTGSVAPGEVKDLDVDPDDPQLQGRIIARAVSVVKSAPEKTEAPAAKDK